MFGKPIHTGKTLPALLLWSAATCISIFAQEGDKEGVQQIDPIPADQIPPAPYLNLEEAVESFQLAAGFVIEPVAYGEDVNLAVALAFDGNGRAWTCEMRSYMPNLDGIGEDTPNGRIRVLEDTDDDGTIDQVSTFMDGLILPRAIAITRDGCLYTSGDTLYFIKRNGTQPIGEPEIVDGEYAKGGNPEHKANGLIYGHDHWYYSAKSSKRYRRVNGKWISQNTNFRGQWGISKDNMGRLFYNSNSTLLTGDFFRPQFFRADSGYAPHVKMYANVGPNRVYPIRITPGINRAYREGMLTTDGKLINATAACGPLIYRGDNFPPEMQGMGFVCEPSAELVKAITIKRDPWNRPQGSHPYGTKEFLASTDEWFLPCNLYAAPDGTIWMLDMYFGLLQHKAYMTSYLRKQYLMRNLHKPQPSTGRIYRIRYAENAPADPPAMEHLTPPDLVPYLSHTNGWHRDTAQKFIVELGDRSILPELEDMALNSSNKLAIVHALWTMEGLGSASPKALIGSLHHHDHDVISTALDIISIQRIRTPQVQQAVAEIEETPPILHSLIRALAASGNPEQAIELCLQHGNQPFVREAFVSGLGSDAASFFAHRSHTGDSTLDKMLKTAANGIPTKRPHRATRLKGKALDSYKRGKTLYTTRAACFGCHGGNGEGQPNNGPPLADSEWVTGDPQRLAKILLHGISGPIEVNGQLYTPATLMPPLKGNPDITDRDLADVMTYIRNDWGNRASTVSAKLVKEVRKATADRIEAYTAKELNGESP